jgi:hypothetical protein
MWVVPRFQALAYFQCACLATSRGAAADLSDYGAMMPVAAIA